MPKNAIVKPKIKKNKYPTYSIINALRNNPIINSACMSISDFFSPSFFSILCALLDENAMNIDEPNASNPMQIMGMFISAQYAEDMDSIMFMNAPTGIEYNAMYFT